MRYEWKHLKKVLILLAIFLPLLQAGGIAFFYFLTKGSGLPMPQWNDEGAYYELIKTWLATGQPEGYWGFNGNHAVIGTSSAWSPAILLPYALFGMMFGWNYSSAFFANTLFLCLANLGFLLLVKPDKKQIVRVILLQMVSVITILYASTLMSEPFRFALAILLAGMIYRLFFLEHGKWFRYLVCPLFILLCVQIYIFMVFVVPVYIFGVLRKTKKKWKLWQSAAFSLVGTALVGGGSYYVLHLISSNYNIYKTENLLQALKAFDIKGIYRSLLWMVYEGLHGLYSCFLTGAGHGMFRWYVPFVLAMILIPLAYLFVRKFFLKKREWGKTEKILTIICFSVSLYLGAYITVYSLEVFTFFRGIGIVVLFSLYLLCMAEDFLWYRGFLVFYAVGMFFLPANLADFSTERYLLLEERGQWDELAAELEEVILIEKDAEPWDNTVVLYTLEPKVIASIPAGAGVNMMMYQTHIPEEAGYLLFSLKTENLRGDWLEQSFYELPDEELERISAKYDEVYRNQSYIVFKKKLTR